MSEPRPALVLDASEWFLDESWREHVAPRHWRRLPSRADDAIRAALEHLQREGVQATFLVPAAVAGRAEELLGELVAAGHEVALSVRAPVPLDELEPGQRGAYRQAWQEERAALEAVIGRGVHGFAGAWSVDDDASESWWRQELRDLGFDYDLTPRRGHSPQARALDGRALDVEWFTAWELDAGQPRLHGLPAEVRAEHEQRLVGAAARLAAGASRASAPVAALLGLDERPPGPPPPEPAPRPDDAPAAVAARRLAVVVPLKDEAEGVPSLFVELELLARALADVATCEFVVVDDGSEDQTWALLEKMARNRTRFRLVRHDTNRGVSAAIRTGMQATDAELVASIDGDLSYDPMELRRMIPLSDAADVVTASPYHPDGDVKNVPEWRLFLSKTLSRVYRLLLRRRVYTWTACFRVYRRNAVLHLPQDYPGFLGTAELAVRVLRRGGVVVEHPCTLEARLLGFSKMRVLRVVFGHLGLLARVALRLVK